MTNYFDGKFCVVDFREVIAISFYKETPQIPDLIEIALTGGIVFKVREDDAPTFLAQYREWIRGDRQKPGPRIIKSLCKHCHEPMMISDDFPHWMHTTFNRDGIPRFHNPCNPSDPKSKTATPEGGL